MFVEVAGLHKRYGEQIALEALSFALHEGEFFALLGPSAAGKTTTLRCLTGIERVDSGRIYLQGTDITDLPVQGRAMGMVFQSFALYPHLSVRNNLAYPLREAGATRRECQQRVSEMAELLGLTHVLDYGPQARRSAGTSNFFAYYRLSVCQPWATPEFRHRDRYVTTDRGVAKIEAALHFWTV